jgi:hypothetical protein
VVPDEAIFLDTADTPGFRRGVGRWLGRVHAAAMRAAGAERGHPDAQCPGTDGRYQEAHVERRNGGSRAQSRLGILRRSDGRKCDLVAGFAESFDDLVDSRKQVWGMTFPRTNRLERGAAAVRGEFDADHA